MASSSRSILVALALVLSAATALAAPPPSPAQRETARRLMDEGKEKTRAGDLARALEAYQKAHDLMHVPTTGLALAKTHLALAHLVEARDVALEVVRLPREPNEPAVFDDARKRARELEASLKPRIPTAKIVVKGAPATKVTVDDGEVAPLLLGEPVALNPGKHAVVAKNADGVEERAEIELAERDAKEVELTLPAPRRASAGAAAKPGDTGSPEARDGEKERGGEQPPTDAPRGERTTGASVLVFGGFGLAAAGLVAGGVTGALAFSKAEAVKPQCANNVCDPAAQSDLDGARTMATIATIAFAVAGVGAACGVIGLVLPRSRATGSGLQWNAGLGPGGAVVRATF